MNLRRTIDQILKIDPQLSKQLSPIKDKYLQRPKRAKVYWEELLTVLNSKPLLDHPHREEMRQLFVAKHQKKTHPLYTFQETDQADTIIGIVPENIADRLRHYDRKTILMAKSHTEAEMTEDKNKLVQLNRENALREIELKKIWVILKDYFKFWDKDLGSTTIKKHGPHLVLVTRKEGGGGGPNQGGIVMQTPFGMAQLNMDDFKKMMKMLGLPPPPGMDDNDA